MARFNFLKRKTNSVLNHEVDKAYRLDSRMELYNLVATSFLFNKYYEDTSGQMKRLREGIRQVKPDFTCKLAVYARKKMYLRSVPLVLLVELVKELKYQKIDKSFIADAVAAVISRPDEITELLAYYQLTNNREGAKKLDKLSRQVRIGIARAFNKFDQYQFAKYDRQAEVTLRDALFLTHPKATDDAQQEIFDKIASKSLETPYTWETQLSEKGNKEDIWMELLDSGKLGYMALLRNLRNILNSGIPYEYLEAVAETLADQDNVRRSKQLPFRFLSAYQQIGQLPGSQVLVEALEEAIAASIDNIEFFGSDRVLIASDVSGSMFYPVSPRSTVQYYDIGLLLSMLLKNKLGDRVTAGIFGNTWKVKNLPKANILANTNHLRQIEGEVGYSTNGRAVLKWALSQKVGFEKIVFFTDCQIYSFERNGLFKKTWKKYKAMFPSAKMYFFNMAGYGNTPLRVNESDVYMISGWSERVFEMLNAVENGSKVLKEIEKIEIG